MSGKKRIASAALALALLFVLLCSACFIVLESGHDCAGEDCRICAQLGICETALHTLLLGVTAAGVLSVPADSAFSRIAAEGKRGHGASLVSLKVKLSD